MKDRVASKQRNVSSGKKYRDSLPGTALVQRHGNGRRAMHGFGALSSNIRWCRSGGSSSIWNGIDSNLYELNNEVVTVIRTFPPLEF